MNKTKKTRIFLISGIMFTLLLGVNINAQKREQNLLITATSVGDVKLGMTVGEAKKVLPNGFKLGPAPGDEGTTLVGVYEGEKLLLTIGSYDDNSKGEEELPPINEKQKIEIMLIMDSRYKTAEGVGVGMSIADAEKKYGSLKEMFNYPHEGEFGKLTSQPEYLRFYFRPKGDFSEAGIYEAVPNCADDAYPPSCRVAKKYNPNSYIFEMSVSSPRPIQQTISIIDTPKDYKVNIYGPMNCDDDAESETTYSISWKVPLENGGGYSEPSQSFGFEGLLPCPELGYGEDNNTVSYKDQRDVFLDDFNFDGMTDLALRDGNNGGYGFASYQVYLFSKEKEEFVLSPPFTELGQYQGMFEVNENRKMIYNWSKSGCCFHQTEGYKILNNKPFKVYDHVVDGMGPTGADSPKITSKKLINGKWRTWDKSSATQVSFDKGKTTKTVSVNLNDNEPIKWLKVGAAKGQTMKVTVDSADAEVKLVDFRGDVSSYESNEPVKEGENFPVKLKGNGDYYLEISAEKNLNVGLTITIENDTSNRK